MSALGYTTSPSRRHLDDRGAEMNSCVDQQISNAQVLSSLGAQVLFSLYVLTSLRGK
jgi:hypothetical protein